jgi:alkylated DNA repair dioxygenase AlkB
VLECKTRSDLQHMEVSKKCDENLWMQQLEELVFRCNYLKFTQHPPLADALIATEDQILGFGGYDRVFGIGVNAKTGLDITKWIGQNLLGKSLMAVRSFLKTKTAPPPPPSQTEQKEEGAAVKWQDVQDGAFTNRRVLMEGDGWALVTHMLHPDLRAQWSAAVMKAPMQKCPKLGYVWNDKPGRSGRNFEFFSQLDTSYEVSKKMFPAKKPSMALVSLLECVNVFRDECFNAMIINEYEHGHHKLGYHSDALYKIGRHGVDTLSFGATRVCRIRKKEADRKGDVVMDVDSVDGLLFSMVGENFQKTFTHEVLEDPTVKTTRRSVTFRWMKS